MRAWSPGRALEPSTRRDVHRPRQRGDRPTTLSIRVLLIARHGETAWSEEGRLISRTDLPLSVVGEEQARALARGLSPASLVRILTSPAQRAVRTAEVIASERPTPVPVVVDPRLREVDLGPFEGRSPADLLRSPLADAFGGWRHESTPRFLPEMETYEVAAVRASELFGELSQGEGITLVVTHAYLARVMIAHSVLGMPLPLLRRLRLDHGRFAIVRWEGSLPRLAGLNLDRFWLSSRP